jgi:hypothetical protein
MVFAQGFEPAPGFFFQIVESGGRGKLSRHNLPSVVAQCPLRSGPE